MATHLALLRGINVGGKNKLPMADLAEIFVAARCTDVRTYIQSGNVVFTATDPVAARIAHVVEKAITERFGLTISVVTRAKAELGEVIRRNPFLPAEPEDTLHVAFLATKPTAAQIATLDPARSPPDRFAVVGREVYLVCPGGFGQTKLTNAYFDAKLGMVSTIRNWRTAQKLLALM